MLSRFLIVCCVLCFSLPAFAEKEMAQEVLPSKEKLKEGVNLDLCRFMVAHKPEQKEENVVSADYQPGVDVHGNPVVEADINAGLNIPNINDLVYRFNLELDILDYLGIENKTAQRIVTNYATVMSYEGRYYISFGVEKQGAIAAYQQLLGAEQEKALQDLCPDKLPEKEVDKKEEVLSAKELDKKEKLDTSPQEKITEDVTSKTKP